MKKLTFSAILGATVCPLGAEIPNRLPHQGRIIAGSNNFNGAGQFKFLLFTDSEYTLDTLQSPSPSSIAT